MKHLVPLVLALFLLPTLSTAQGEEQGGQDGWLEAKGVPAWVMAPPVRAGYVRTVDGGRSNLLSLAYYFDDAGTRRTVKETIARRLRPLLGVDADKAAAASVAKPVLVKKAYHSDSARNTKIAWVLWEVPSARILAAVSADKRKAAAAALLRPEPADSPAWTEAAEAPPWVSAPQKRDGHMSIVVMERAGRQDVARANASLFAGSRVGWHVEHRLRKLLGEKVTGAAGFAATRWRILFARASVPIEGETKAWEHWHVPLDRILAAVPEPHRKEARRLLLTPSGDR